MSLGIQVDVEELLRFWCERPKGVVPKWRHMLADKRKDVADHFHSEITVIVGSAVYQVSKHGNRLVGAEPEIHAKLAYMILFTYCPYPVPESGMCPKLIAAALRILLEGDLYVQSGCLRELLRKIPKKPQVDDAWISVKCVHKTKKLELSQLKTPPPLDDDEIYVISDVSYGDLDIAIFVELMLFLKNNPRAFITPRDHGDLLSKVQADQVGRLALLIENISKSLSAFMPFAQDCLLNCSPFIIIDLIYNCLAGLESQHVTATFYELLIYQLEAL